MIPRYVLSYRLDVISLKDGSFPPDAVPDDVLYLMRLCLFLGRGFISRADFTAIVERELPHMKHTQIDHVYRYNLQNHTLYEPLLRRSG